MKAKLSQKQAEVCVFMVEFFNENDQLPPVATIATHFGWSSPNAAFEQVRALERKGFIERNALGKYRFRRARDA